MSSENTAPKKGSGQMGEWRQTTVISVTVEVCKGPEQSVPNPALKEHKRVPESVFILSPPPSLLCVCHGAHVEVIAQLQELVLLPLCGFQRLNLMASVSMS